MLTFPWMADDGLSRNHETGEYTTSNITMEVSEQAVQLTVPAVTGFYDGMVYEVWRLGRLVGMAGNSES